jgi:hypothetical protein
LGATSFISLLSLSQMYHFPPAPLFLDARTADRKAEVLGLVPLPEHLIRAAAPPPLPVDPDLGEKVLQLKQEREAFEEREAKEEESEGDDAIVGMRKRKRSYQTVSLAQKDHLSELWRKYGENKDPMWYSSETGIKIHSARPLLSMMKSGKSICMPGVKRGRPQKITDPWANQVCRDALLAMPTTTLRELEAGLADTDSKMSVSSIDRMLTKVKDEEDDFPLFTFKRLSVRGAAGNSPENKDARIDFIMKLDAAYRSGRLVVYMDETSWNAECIRKYGWSPKGEKAIVPAPPSFTSFTAITSISQNGMGWTEVIRGNIDANLFLSYLQRFAVTIPPGVHCTVVLDNARIHHVSAEGFLLSAGHEILFNAAYSPEANPIERIFGIWKARVERECRVWQGIDLFYEAIRKTFTDIEEGEVRAAIEGVRANVWPKIFSRSDL